MKSSIGYVAILLALGSASALRAQGPSYTKDVQPFLQKYCIECHQGTKAKAGVNLESFETVMKGSKKGRKIVLPGQADKSQLVTCVEGSGGRKMPPKKAAHQPTAKEIEVLRSWVNSGAMNDTQKQSYLDSSLGPNRPVAARYWAE